MIQLDIAYIRQRSLRLDMQIILRTIPAILMDLKPFHLCETEAC